MRRQRERSADCRSEQHSAFKITPEAGLNINDAAFTEENFKATPLWYAVAFGKNITLARFLLSEGSEPNSCMFAAAYNDDAPMIRLLAENGAVIDPEVEGATPLLSLSSGVASKLQKSF